MVKKRDDRSIHVDLTPSPPPHVKSVVSLTTALLIGKLMQEREGDPTYIHQAMERIMQDPKLCGGVALTLLNLLGQYAENTQGRLEGLCMYFTKETMELSGG